MFTKETRGFTKETKGVHTEKAEAPMAPLDAATVILTRENEKGSFDIFLMRRHKKQSFMGGAFVFPGGRVDEADCDPQLHAFADGLDVEEARQKLGEADLPADKALGLFFAAVRETFEEARILLASDAEGKPIHLTDDQHVAQWETDREKIHEGEITLTDLARKENIRFALDHLMPYSHWITPEVETKRFDTRFLVARMPGEQRPRHDAIEMTESIWLTPSEALKRQKAGNLPLMPPTLKTIEELSEFSSIDHLFSSAASRKIQTILPQAFQAEGGFGVKLPYDPEYTLEDYKQPLRPGEPSRIVLIDDKWETRVFS